MNIHTILWPTDFSDDSRHALEHAVAIARWYSARIVALHACSPAMVDAPVLVGAGPGARSSHATCAEELQLLEEIESRRGAGIETAVDVVKGSAARAIVDYASTHPIDLIVLGTHGAGGFEHLILGSVTERA